MAFQGEVLPIGALLERARTAPAATPAVEIGLRHTAADNAQACADLLAAGEAPEAGWRFGILQTLDDYTSTLRRGGSALASGVFAHEPPPTGSRNLDAAFAALAEYLANRDKWNAPEWTLHPSRTADAWFPAVPAVFRDEAQHDSPAEFRTRGIYITTRSLDRA